MIEVWAKVCRTGSWEKIATWFTLDFKGLKFLFNIYKNMKVNPVASLRLYLVMLKAASSRCGIQTHGSPKNASWEGFPHWGLNWVPWSQAQQLCSQ